MPDAGGLWSLLTVVGPVLLAAAMIYGIVSYRNRSRAAKQAGEDTAKRIYREGANEERRSS